MIINNLNFNIKDVGKGVPFVWGHGLLCSMSVENSLNVYKHDEIAHIVRLIRYDAIGHGDTDASLDGSDYYWPRMALHMESIAKTLKTGPFIAGGQSLGSAMALYAAINSPGEIKGLVLVNPPSAWEYRAKQTAKFKKMAIIAGLLGGKLLGNLEKLVVRKSPEVVLPHWLAGMEGNKGELLIEGIINKKGNILNKIFMGTALSDLPGKELIRKINQPTLILAWESDDVHPVSVAKELKDLIKNSELHISAGYNEVIEWPELIKAFLKRIKP
jgi:pimeloyl-ACP methyl ester carboxylesterase